MRLFITILHNTLLRAAAFTVILLGATYRYAAGVQYDWSNDFSIGAAYTLIDAGKAKVNRSGGPLKGDLEGDYDPNFIHAFNLNFVYRF